MLKQFLNGGSLKSLMRFDAETEQGDARDKLRQEIAKGNIPPVETVKPDVVSDASNDTDPDDTVTDPDVAISDPPEETEAQKKEREAAEKIAAKETRKNDRMQRRIDEAVAEREKYKKELEAFKTANPDVKLTEEEVQTRAEKIAADKLAADRAKEIQEKFDDTCAKLYKASIKIDKDFDAKIHDMAEQFGPIPSFMIRVLDDFDNGAEVLALMANDDDIAEKIYNLQTSPAKMTKELVSISNKLIEAKKPPKKEISKVPAPIEPVNGSRSISTIITEADTKPENMNSYVAKRRAQMEAAKKARGW